MTNNWERRILQSYGSNVRFDINNPQVTVGGKDIYNFYGVTTEEEDVCLVGLQENGTYRIWNDKTVEIVGGQKAGESGVDVIIAGKNGDVVINADKNGRVRIRAKDIVLQADEDVDIIGGRNVTLSAGSGRVLVKGNTLEKTGLKGNLLEANKQWAYRVFEGTGLPSFAFSALASPFGGIAQLATSIVSNPTSLASFASNAVSGAISQATGGLVDGSILTNPTGALTNLASGQISNATGGLLDGSVLSNPVGSLTNVATNQLSNATGGLSNIVTDNIDLP